MNVALLSSFRQSIKLIARAVGVFLALFAGYFILLMFGYYHISAAYDLVEHGMTRQQVDDAVGWFLQVDIARSEVEPAWKPGSSGNVTKCGLGSLYFYVVYEDDVAVEVIPAFE